MLLGAANGALGLALVLGAVLGAGVECVGLGAGAVFGAGAVIRLKRIYNF
jgi:hypothetical protein